MTEVHARKLSKQAMAEGNESEYSIVIDNDIVKEWVGIGWIELRQATEDDLVLYPTVTRERKS